VFHVHGHELALRLLKDGLAQGRLHHAYLLSGPTHVGKTTVAMQLAQAVNCTEDDSPCGHCNSCIRIIQGFHADVRTISLEAAEGEESRSLIGIDAIRDLQSSAYLKPYEGNSHVFIIQDADRLSAEAANALLKVLEEPPPEVLLLLLTSDSNAVLATIASRCQTLELRPMPVARVAEVLQQEHGQSIDHAESIARLSRGCVGWAIQAARGPEPLADLHKQVERIADVSMAGLEVRFAYADELARRFQRDRAAGRRELYLWLRWWRDVLLIQRGRDDEIMHRSWRETLKEQAQLLSQPQTVAWIERMFGSLESLERNANPRLALEALMLDLPRGSHTAVQP
jgi:DNA polymerase-3 subunit delta'